MSVNIQKLKNVFLMGAGSYSGVFFQTKPRKMETCFIFTLETAYFFSSVIGLQFIVGWAVPTRITRNSKAIEGQGWQTSAPIGAWIAKRRGKQKTARKEETCHGFYVFLPII